MENNELRKRYILLPEKGERVSKRLKMRLKGMSVIGHMINDLSIDQVEIYDLDTGEEHKYRIQYPREYV